MQKNIYKYESFSLQTLQNIKNSQIFFNAPINFNDPFDCSILNKSINYSDDEILKINNYYSKEEHKIKYVNKIQDIDEDIRKSIVDGIKNGVTIYHKQLLHQRGCSCFSEKVDDILMWSHYANGHKGFCLEFDTNCEPFNGAMKVSYESDFPLINPSSILFGEEGMNDFFKPLLTKYKNWSYEKEWRIFHKEPNKLYCYPVNSLKAVYFGSEIEYVNIEILCLILQGQNKNIKFYKCKKDESSYKVDFEEFQYIPYKNKIP